MTHGPDQPSQQEWMPPEEWIKTVHFPTDHERVMERLDRIESLLEPLAASTRSDTEANFCTKYGHQWNWLGGGPTFCTRCGLETHS